MNKVFQYLVSALLALMFALSQIGPASAKSNVAAASNSCQVNIAAKSGVAPFKTTIEVTGVNGSTMVIFGDNTPDKLGRLQEHTFHPVGKFTVTAIVNGTDGFPYRCHGYVTSLPNGEMEIPDFEFENNVDQNGGLLKHPTIIEIPVMATGDISADHNDMGPNEGENSFGFVNSGNGDVTVTIERAPEPIDTVIPQPDIDKCSDNTAQGSEPQINICGNSGTIIINVNPVPVHNPTFLENLGAAFADLIRSWIN